MTKCDACNAEAVLHAKWGTQGQEGNLCLTHASEMHESTKGAVAKQLLPSPTYIPVDVYLRSKAAVRDDRAAMRGI
jgi:hypothetical protein